MTATRLAQSTARRPDTTPHALPCPDANRGVLACSPVITGRVRANALARSCAMTSAALARGIEAPAGTERPAQSRRSQRSLLSTEGNARRPLCLREREPAQGSIRRPQWTRRATTARSPKRSCLGPAERKHRRAGSSEQQILLLARGEAGASTRDRDAIGSRFEHKAARTRSRLRLLPVVAHARDRALADRASVSALIDRCCFHRRSGVVDHAAPARIATRAGSDSRLQPVKHEPHGSGATL